MELVQCLEVNVVEGGGGWSWWLAVVGGGVTNAGKSAKINEFEKKTTVHVSLFRRGPPMPPMYTKTC